METIKATGTATARDKSKSFYRFYCIRGHAHRTEPAAQKCEAAFHRFVKRQKLPR